MAPGPGRDAVLFWTPAKVNLFLEVHARRPDGFHEISTLMVTVNLFDTLEIRLDHSGDISLTCNRVDLSIGDDNLVVRAAKLLRAHTGCSLGAAITLTKRIPMAAGLAGGSSDGAATLSGLNRLWKLGLANNDLIHLAAELGSDVAFFFHAPCAWATGRGEIVTPVPTGRPLDLVLITPTEGLSTAMVYRHLKVPTAPRDGTEIRDAMTAGDVNRLGKALWNRLQESAMELSPVVTELDHRLRNMGTAGCLMSGSGSSLFALCRDRTEATRVMHALREEVVVDHPGLRVEHVRTCF